MSSDWDALRKAADDAFIYSNIIRRDEPLDEKRDYQRRVALALVNTENMFAGADALHLTPNGYGGMRIVVNFPNPGDEKALFDFLSGAMPDDK